MLTFSYDSFQSLFGSPSQTGTIGGGITPMEWTNAIFICLGIIFVMILVLLASNSTNQMNAALEPEVSHEVGPPDPIASDFRWYPAHGIALRQLGHRAIPPLNTSSFFMYDVFNPEGQTLLNSVILGRGVECQFDINGVTYTGWVFARSRWGADRSIQKVGMMRMNADHTGRSVSLFSQLVPLYIDHTGNGHIKRDNF